MGWSFGWHDRHEMIAHMLNPICRTTVIDHSVHDDHVWTLHQVRPGSGTEAHPEGSCFIRMHLLEMEDGEWGMKTVSEAEGPYLFDCPLSILDRSDDQSGYAVRWRERCRRQLEVAA